MMKKLLLASVTAAALVMGGGARATTIYSNFGTTSPTFNETTGYGVHGALVGGPGKFGAEFTVPGAGAASVTGADVALEHILINGSNGVVDASFWTVSAGIPGAQIGGFFAVTAPAGFPPSVVSISNITGITLAGGQSYFLVLTPSDDFSSVDWFANNQGAIGGVADIGGGWQSIGATAATPVFDVTGTVAPVPEPASWAVLGAGLAGLAGLKLARSANRSRFPFQAHLRRVFRVVVRMVGHDFPLVELLAPVRVRRQLALRAMREGEPSRALPEYLNKEIA
jgi:hypothetical protein